MSVDPAIVEWLKTGTYYAPATDAGVIAKWGAMGTTSQIDSPLALKAGAGAEGARQIAFLGGPLVLDQHLIPGRRNDLKQRCITLVIGRLGYDAGVRVFVLSAEESSKGDQTTLTVLRRL